MNFKKPSRILFVHDGPLYKGTNGQFYGVSLNDELRKRYLEMGSQVRFLIRVRPLDESAGVKYTAICNDDFDVIEIPDFKSVRNYFVHRAQAKRIVSEAVQQSDIVIARMPSGAGAMAVHFAHKYNIPLLAEMVACTKETYWYHSVTGKLIAHYSFFKQKAIMKKVHYCLYVTQHFLQERYPIKGKSIACSDVNIVRTDKKVLKARIHKIHSMAARQSLVIGSVGKLSMRLKGYKDVIEAVAMLNRMGIAVEYRLVGAGDTTYLKKIIKKWHMEQHVTLLGPMPHAKIAGFMDDIDLYIQPSRTEGLPRAMIEAMSRACPVAGSNVGGIPELAHPGILFQSGNAWQIYQCLLSFDRKKLVQEAARSFNKAQEYEKEVLTEKRLAFYKQFLREHNLTC